MGKRSGIADRICRAAARCGRALRRFAREGRASVSVEFVVSIPILLAVLVIASEYGRVLLVRMTLESAVAEAARYLGRSPLLAGEEAFPPESEEIARGLVTSRLAARDVTVSVGMIGGRRTVELFATASVDTPLLAFLADLLGLGAGGGAQAARSYDGLVVGAADTVLHFGR